MNSPDETISDPGSSDFRISNCPVAATPIDAAGEEETTTGDFCLLPRSYGRPFVSALARHPTSLFVYWEIDWPSLFARGNPRDREVFLRLQNQDGAEISKVAIEPMAGHCELTVPNSNSAYRVELGYFNAENIWHSAGVANVVSTPSDSLREPAEETFATFPFHLSFERLTELIYGSGVEDSPVGLLGQIQKKALHPQRGQLLTSAEEEILRALETSLPAGWQDKAKNPGREVDSEKRLRETLDFGSGSPTSSLGRSSWV